MPKNPNIEPEFLRQVLRYEPETGRLFWLERAPETFQSKKISAANAWNAKYAFQPALCNVDAGGYLYGPINRIKIKAHRVAFAMHHGRWPKNFIDHINGNRTDNRIANLRDVTRSENMRNASLSRKNASGFCGVTFDKQVNKWKAQIGIDGRCRNLGVFHSKQDAIDARINANQLYGFGDRHGLKFGKMK